MNKNCWNAQHRLANWLISWIEVIENLLNIITFTLYRPWWDMTLRVKYMKYCMKKRKNG